MNFPCLWHRSRASTAKTAPKIARGRMVASFGKDAFVIIVELYHNRIKRNLVGGHTIFEGGCPFIKREKKDTKNRERGKIKRHFCL